MAFMMLPSWVALVMITVAVQGTPPTQLSNGVYIKEAHPIFYETSLPLIYEVDIPDFKTLLKYNYVPCSYDCRFTTQMNAVLDSTRKSLMQIFPEPGQTRRSKRSLEFVGDFSSWCCGVATQNSLDKLVDHENNLERFVSGVKTQMANRDANIRKSLSTYSADMAILWNNSRIHENNEMKVLARNEEKIEASLKQKEALFVEAVVTMHGIAQEQLWGTVWADCRNGKIPHALVNRSSLVSDLVELEQRIKKEGFITSIKPENVQKYYSLSTTSCTFSSTKVLVVVKIPIIKTTSKYQLLRVTPIPFRHNYTVCQLTLDTEMLITSQFGMVPLTNEASTRCTFQDQELCFVPRYPTKFHSNHGCLSTIINKPTVAQLVKSCGFLCMDHSTKQTEVFQVENHRFIIFNPKGPVTLKCPGQKDQIYTPKELSTTQVDIPCGCKMFGESIEIEQLYPCDQSAVKEFEIRHLYPGAWTQNPTPFVNNETLYEDLQGIINPNWTQVVPILNMTPVTTQEIPMLEVPLLQQVSPHLSLLATVWMTVMTVVLVWLVHRTTSVNLPPMIFPVARAESFSSIHPLEFTLQATTLLIGVCCLLLLLGVYFAIKHSALFNINKKVAGNNAKVSILVKENSKPKEGTDVKENDSEAQISKSKKRKNRKARQERKQETPEQSTSTSFTRPHFRTFEPSEGPTSIRIATVSSNLANYPPIQEANVMISRMLTKVFIINAGLLKAMNDLPPISGFYTAEMKRGAVAALRRHADRRREILMIRVRQLRSLKDRHIASPTLRCNHVNCTFCGKDSIADAMRRMRT
jgi:hypothetical protein